MVIGDGRMVKAVTWYDNEWGYSNRCVELAGKVLRRSEPGPGRPMSFAKASVRDAEVAGRRVLVRVDFNVPLDERRGRRRHADPGGAADDRAAARARRRAGPRLPPRAAQGQARPGALDGAGRPSGSAELLGAEVQQAPGGGRRASVERMAGGLGPGRGAAAREQSASSRARPRTTRSWPKRWRELADLYVNDAFGAAHRAHATTEGVAHHLPAYAGLLLEREVSELTAVVESPERPLVVVLGGAKVTDKVGVIDRFLEVADQILIGGAMCFSFFRAQGIATGDSLVEEEGVELAAEALERAEDSDCELLLPVDLVLGESFDADTERRESDGVEVPDGWMGLDIGPAHRRALRRGDRRGRDGALERADGRLRAGAVRRPAPAPSPRRSPRRRGRPWSAAATRSPRCSSSASPTGSTGSRPAAGPRWSCWRERSCRAWRRCSTTVEEAAMPERTPYIAANWKMHKTVAEAARVRRRAAAADRRDASRDVVICPPFTALSAVVERRYGTAVRVAAQNMHEEDSGAFTGEVSAPMLVELGVEAVILGHSERRQLFGETDEALARKVPAALAAGLEPILCVGETEEARDARRDRGSARAPAAGRPGRRRVRRAGRGRHRLRADLGDRHRPHRDARAGPGGDRLHPRRARARAAPPPTRCGSSTAAR